MNNWYEENIEEPVREIVKILRDNGINTTTSCGHSMEIEGSYNMDGELKVIHDKVYQYLGSKKLPIDYKIYIILQVRDGYIFTNYFRLVFNNIID